jgi:cytochrome b561
MRRLGVAGAVLGAPLAWIAQLAVGYSFEETACSPGDGTEVWSVSVRTMHIAVGSVALALALAALLSAVALKRRPPEPAARAEDTSFLAVFGVASGLLFSFTIVLTAVGSAALAVCHAG